VWGKLVMKIRDIFATLTESGFRIGTEGEAAEMIDVEVAADVAGIRLAPNDGATDFRMLSADTADTWTLRDETAGTDPFCVAGGAPDNSLKVESTGDVGIGTASPGTALDVLRTGAVAITVRTTTAAAAEIKLSNGVPQAFDIGVAGGGALRFDDITAGTTPFRIDVAASNGALRILASGTVQVGTGLMNMPRQTTAADPTTTEFPNADDCGFHENTTSGDVFWVYNKGGTIHKVKMP
jgi:hypothetical protein